MAEGRDHADSGLGLPYVNRTPQEEGRRVEKKTLRSIGARQHPMSGAGRIKEDGSDEDNLYEVKWANRSFTLNSSDLRMSWQRAAREAKDSVWIVRFANGIDAIIHLEAGNPP